MHMVVVGCGRVGAGLAMSLQEEGHTVAVVDRNKKAFGRLPDSFAGRTIQGVGFDREVLREAGVEDATGLASVTSGDNSNIVIARVAREHFGIERVVARIYDVRRAAIYERLGIPTVATVGWTVERVLSRLKPETANLAWVDPSARVCLIERPVPPAWAGRPLAQLDISATARVVALTRLGVATIPTSELVCQEGDVVWVAVAEDGIATTDAHLSAPTPAGRH